MSDQDWERLAAKVREAREELDAAALAHKRTSDLLEEAEECFRSAKGELIEHALGPAASLPQKRLL